jgi:hypothetical protein
MTMPLPAVTAAGPRLLASGLALLVWFGVLLQLVLSLQLAQANGKSLIEGVLVYLGYFTVLSNGFVALVLTLPLADATTRPGRFFARPVVQSCAAISIVLVGLGYHLLLRHIWNPQGLQWLADGLLHYVTPLLFCLYWLWFAPKQGLGVWALLAACLYPLAYFVYALLRGAWLGSYPYPFIDVGVIGYGQACRNALGLLLAYVVVGALLLALGRALAGCRRSRSSPARSQERR